MKIGIISLGLIGGSLFKCLAETENEIYAVTRNTATIEKAKKYSKNISNEINILSECEVIFTASPINKTLEILDKLEKVVNKNCIVLDCSSVKEFVMKKNRSYIFIGSHPMAGTENNGFDASFKELFNGAKWVLTPDTKAKNEHLEKVKSIISITGAQTIITDAKSHDEAVALISHMPLILSQALFYTASKNELALKLASSGFRDMTRLAMSNLEMAKDMRFYNNQNIKNALSLLETHINSLINTQDNKIFEDIKQKRTNMYSKEGKNIL